MTTPWIHPALGALALAGIAGSAHAAWGHSDYAHVQAYQQLEAIAAPRKAASSQAIPAIFLHDPVTIRAFDEDFAELRKSQTRKAKRSDRAAGPARS